MLWIVVTVLLMGCGSETAVIEITYPSETTMAEHTAFAGTESVEDEETSDSPAVSGEYVLNISSKKFHDPCCSSVSSIKEKNREEYTGEREALLLRGFTPCGRCKP